MIRYHKTRRPASIMRATSRAIASAVIERDAPQRIAVDLTASYSLVVEDSDDAAACRYRQGGVGHLI